MSATPVPHRHASGVTTWRQPFRLTPGGQVTTETFDTRAEALQFGKLVDKIGGQAARDVRNASDSSALDMPTLKTWLETHLKALKASRTPGTIAEYRRTAKRTWLPTLGPLPLDAVTRTACVEWVAAQREVEIQTSIRRRAKAAKAGTDEPEPILYSVKSITNAHGILSSVLQSAVDADPPMIERNVAKGVSMPSDALGEEMVFLTSDEFAILLDKIPPYWRPLVVALVGTGMRFGEATALTVGDIDPTTDMVRIVKAWKKGATGVYLGTPKSKKGRRTIQMGTVVRAVVLPLLEGRAPVERLFVSVEGKRVQAQHFRERVWHPAVIASEIGKRPRVHDLRHSHASWLLGAGVPPQVVQHRLGHESLETTSRVYSHLLPDAQVAATLAADAAMRGIGR